MKMKLFEDCKIKFEQANWSKNSELGLVDTLFETHPELIQIASGDILKGCNTINLGRGDTPSAEQIVRAAIYKELKGLDYRELEYDQSDSRICEHFLKIDPLRPCSFQMFQKYIVKIKQGTIEKILFEINRIAICEGLEDVEYRDYTKGAKRLYFKIKNTKSANL